MPPRNPRDDPRTGDVLRATIRVRRVEDQIVYYVIEDNEPIWTELCMPLDTWRALAIGRVEVMRVADV